MQNIFHKSLMKTLHPPKHSLGQWASRILGDLLTVLKCFFNEKMVINLYLQHKAI